MPACENARLGFYSLYLSSSACLACTNIRTKKQKKGQWREREKNRPTTSINNSTSSRTVGVRQKTRKEKYTNENKSLPSASIPTRGRGKERSIKKRNNV